MDLLTHIVASLVFAAIKPARYAPKTVVCDSTTFNKYVALVERMASVDLHLNIEFDNCQTASVICDEGFPANGDTPTLSCPRGELNGDIVVEFILGLGEHCSASVQSDDDKTPNALLVIGGMGPFERDLYSMELFFPKDPSRNQLFEFGRQSWMSGSAWSGVGFVVDEDRVLWTMNGKSKRTTTYLYLNGSATQGPNLPDEIYHPLFAQNDKRDTFMCGGSELEKKKKGYRRSYGTARCFTITRQPEVEFHEMESMMKSAQIGVFEAYQDGDLLFANKEAEIYHDGAWSKVTFPNLTNSILWGSTRIGDAVYAYNYGYNGGIGGAGYAIQCNPTMNIQEYNRENDEWTLHENIPADMEKGESRLGALNGKLYFVGGRNGTYEDDRDTDFKTWTFGVSDKVFVRNEAGEFEELEDRLQTLRRRATVLSVYVP